MIAPALSRFEEMLQTPFDESLEFTNEKIAREWVWCDALFMSPPALALATSATDDRRYADLMDRLWWKTTDYLYDKEEHLYSRDSRFFGQREVNGKKVFWSRGNGWVLAGLARVLQYLPEDYPERPRFLTLFQGMAKKIASLQGDDGYWRTSLLDPDSWPAPETSGTGFFTYALAWGVNQGLLDTTLRYSHLAPAHKTAALAILDGAFNGRPYRTITAQSIPQAFPTHPQVIESVGADGRD